MENRVLWTGGWDSTFLLLQMARENGKGSIRPVYVAGDNRKSEENELQTMKLLLPKIRTAAGEGTQVEDLLIVDKADIPGNPEITAAYETIRKTVRIGTQYEWLARLAMQYPGLAIGIEKPNGEYSGCIAAIESTGAFREEEGCLVIDREESSKECCLLFGNFCFPLAEVTETDMIRLVKEWHQEELMKGVWFCHKPINGSPCGYCRPCQQKMECEMQWLVPEEAQKRYHQYRRLVRLFGEQNSMKMMNKRCRKPAHIQ